MTIIGEPSMVPGGDGEMRSLRALDDVLGHGAADHRSQCLSGRNEAFEVVVGPFIHNGSKTDTPYECFCTSVHAARNKPYHLSSCVLAGVEDIISGWDWSIASSNVTVDEGDTQYWRRSEIPNQLKARDLYDDVLSIYRASLRTWSVMGPDVHNTANEAAA
ncbi:hypothetical protein B0I35DRAFT_484030 [Stachybotrys elegans]|uniref:Uncharacterized protein n=1 Tax=Stachybotrys elegans TaxID=80388 RepID=A0A8K0SFX0_9HYPO|nr:hypothetical protein B0I35DRAFT_484030 [Stachybotrys elegans]